MASNAITLSGKALKLQSITAAPPSYSEVLKVVASSPGAGEILPVLAGNAITLPGAETVSNVKDIAIKWNTTVLEESIHYNWLGVSPHTQFTLNFDLNADDYIAIQKLS